MAVVYLRNAIPSTMAKSMDTVGQNTTQKMLVLKTLVTTPQSQLPKVPILLFEEATPENT